MDYLLIFTVGVIFGFALFYGLLKLNAWYQVKKLEEDYNSIYSEILGLVGSKSLKFVNRYNNTVTFRVNLKSHGVVDLIYLIDKKDLNIFRGNVCMYSSFYTDKKILNELCQKIDTSYNKELMDCVDVMGNIIDRRTITKLNPNVQFPAAFPIVEPDPLNLDDILDKINAVGLDKLTPEEKEFLKNQK